MSPEQVVRFSSRARGTDWPSYEGTAVRGGRKMEERGARTGEDGSGETPVFTLFAKAGAGLAFGSP
jgi:hypothetical protein